MQEKAQIQTSEKSCKAGRVAVNRNGWDGVKLVLPPQTREVNEAEVNSFDVSNGCPGKNASGRISDHLGLLVDQERACGS